MDASTRNKWHPRILVLYLTLLALLEVLIFNFAFFGSSNHWQRAMPLLMTIWSTAITAGGLMVFLLTVKHRVWPLAVQVLHLVFIGVLLLGLSLITVDVHAAANAPPPTGPMFLLGPGMVTGVVAGFLLYFTLAYVLILLALYLLQYYDARNRAGVMAVKE